METIISALISAGVTLAVCLITQHMESAKTTAILEVKLDELTKRVEKHNSLIDRTYALEQKVEVQEEKIKVANHRISDLEDAQKKGES